MQFGMEGSGVVAQVGEAVTRFKPGDPVFGFDFQRPAIPLVPTAFCSDYVVLPEGRLFLKPEHLSFEEVAGLLATTITAYQSFKHGAELAASGEDLYGFFSGKTVFVPGGLGGTGFSGLLLAKNVLGAGKVITSVSTAKVSLVEQYLPGVVDQVVDYQTQDVVATVGKGTVDFVYNTQGSIPNMIPLLKPESGVIVSIAGVPPSSVLEESLGPGNYPAIMGWMVDGVQCYYSWKMRGTKVKSGFVTSGPWPEEDLQNAVSFIADGKIKPIMTVVSIDDMDKVHEECQKLYAGKGALGKLIIKFK
jgi:NADPH:quinone reductase-like Zn-dependent oxidoreductase